MSKLLNKLGSGAVVIGGFLVVFFGSSKFSSQETEPRLGTLFNGADVAHADAPYSQSAYYAESAYYAQGTYGDSGSGDSGGSGGDSGGSK